MSVTRGIKPIDATSRYLEGEMRQRPKKREYYETATTQHKYNRTLRYLHAKEETSVISFSQARLGHDISTSLWHVLHYKTLSQSGRVDTSALIQDHY